MRRHGFFSNLRLPLLAALALLVVAAQAAAVTDEEVDAAIEKGIAHILSFAQPDGKFSPDGKYMWVKYAYPYGHEAIAMMALAHAKVSLKDERMRKGFEFLLTAPLEHTYTRACRVITIARLMPQLGREEGPIARKVMEQDVKWLLDIQRVDGPDEGMWSYPTAPNGNVDFSNTQFAILALSEFEAAGGDLPAEPYLKAQKAFLERQRPDGGWNYGWIHPKMVNDPSYDAMTAVGVASLYIIRDKLYLDAVCPCRGGQSGKRPQRIDDSILAGIRWLGKNYVAKTGSGHNLYMHYACARVGLAAGLKHFGPHDWYREGAEHIVRLQKKDGGWAPHERLDHSCFALMFLLKGRAPILLNKLQFDGKWDMHPRDAAHLARYVGTVKEQDMNWQVISLDAPVDQWHDAPILYVSAESAPELTDEQKEKLRRYTDTGGTVLFEASCSNPHIVTWWRNTCKQIWPEWELRQLAKDHPLWSSDLALKGRLPLMLGISDGVRTFVLFSPKDISCQWHTYAVTQNRPLFDLGCNLYAYATDRGKLRSKLAAARTAERKEYQAATVTHGPRDTLRVRLLEHGGDWYVSHHYRPLEALAASVAARAQTTLQVGEPIPATDEAAKQTDVFWLTGRKDIRLSAEETAALKAFLAGGGYLVAEACMGDAAFDTAFRTLAGELGLTIRAADPQGGLVTGGMTGCAAYNLGKVDFTFALRTERVGKTHAELRGLYLGDRLVGVCSPFDVSLAVAGVQAFGSRGYEPADATAVATNMILPATAAAVKAQ